MSCGRMDLPAVKADPLPAELNGFGNIKTAIAEPMWRIARRQLLVAPPEGKGQQTARPSLGSKDGRAKFRQAAPRPRK